MIALLLMIQAAAAPPLNLTCMGGGTANKPDSAMAWSQGRMVQVTGERQQGFQDQVDLKLFGGDDRMRLPRTLLPGLHGGTDGWFRVKITSADARAIHGSVAVNFINNPKFFIDRVTGTISISGKAGDFTGQCQAMSSDATPKF